jgi:hypothetical protein
MEQLPKLQQQPKQPDLVSLQPDLVSLQPDSFPQQLSENPPMSSIEALPKEIIEQIFLNPDPRLVLICRQVSKRFFNWFIPLGLKANNEDHLEKFTQWYLIRMQKLELSEITLHKEQISRILSCETLRILSIEASFSPDTNGDLDFSRLKVCKNFMIKANMIDFNGKFKIKLSHATEIFHIDFRRFDRKTSKAVPGLHYGEITLHAEECTKLKDW